MHIYQKEWNITFDTVYVLLSGFLQKINILSVNTIDIFRAFRVKVKCENACFQLGSGLQKFSNDRKARKSQILQLQLTLESVIMNLTHRARITKV